jgi:hypothetical protein
VLDSLILSDAFRNGESICALSSLAAILLHSDSRSNRRAVSHSCHSPNRFSRPGPPEIRLSGGLILVDFHLAAFAREISPADVCDSVLFRFSCPS